MNFKSSLSIALLVSTTGLTSIFTIAHAEESIEEVVVTATRYARNVSDIGSSISVISAEDLEKSQTVFVQDILQSVPGLTLNQNGAFGGVSSMRIRGASSAQTVILIDGIQLNDVSNPAGSYDFSNLDPNGIQQIEVLRGPQSILYGSDAIGGVINIITPTGEDGFKGNIFAEGGSYNTYRAGGNIAGGTDNFNYSLSTAGITTDGISKADENNGNTERDGYRHISLQGKLTGKISENHRIQIISRYNDSRNEYDSFGPSDGAQVGFSKEFLIAGRGFFDYMDGALENIFSVEYSTIDRRRETADMLDFNGKSEGKRFNLDYFGHYKFDEHFEISFGLQHEETESKTASPKKFNIDSIFSEVSYQGIKGLTLTAGLRYDDHNQYGNTTTPRLTAAYYIADKGFKIFANWGEGFKAPSAYQLTYVCDWCGLTEPNANLRPEESSGWEIGLEKSLMDDKIQFGVTYFDQKITNMIDFDFVVGYGNIANVRTKGVELSLQAQIDNISLNGNYTYTDATDKDTGVSLIRVPRNAAFAEIDWQVITGINFALSMTYNGKETDSYTPGTDGWVRFDLRTSYQLYENIEVYGRIDNLLNKEYQQVYGYGTADRSYYVGIRDKF